MRFCFVLVLATVCSSCVQCRNTVLSRELSPDRRIEAVTYQRDCGAAVSTFSTQVALVNPGMNPPGKGNVFIINSDGAPFAPPRVSVSWRSPAALAVTYHEGQVIFTSPKVEDVLVTFQRAK